MLRRRCCACIWLFVVSTCIIESATDEQQPLQRYLGDDDALLSKNKRFKQIMQGASPLDVGWPQPPKSLTVQTNVDSELAKLNTSYVYQTAWPDPSIVLGSVTAVSFDKAGNVVIFHRVDRIWGERTFDVNNKFQDRKKGPIRDDTVLALDREKGRMVYSWGKNLFYMPHGLTIDHEDNVWVTDVALHQVFKFGPKGSNDTALLTLGTAFTPGLGEKFCKPTSVAVLENGDFFVADGYCNGRIVKYSKEGQQILIWGKNSFSAISFDFAPPYFFAIPHALTLVPEHELLCAADRENGRVQCFFWINGTFHSQYHSPLIGDRLFSMDYTPARGGQLIIVNGVEGRGYYEKVQGFVLDIRSKKVLSKFAPNDLHFDNPHDVSVTKDGNEIYIAELDPKRIHKFLHKSIAKPLSLSAAKPTATSGSSAEHELAATITGNETLSAANENGTKPHRRPGTTAILVATLMLLFAFLTFAMALLIARRRKRGCFPFGANNRRHAWDFPAKPEGFKLGGLLMDRSKHNGFEKLEQDASDEEHEASTNMLASAQFA